MGKLEIVWKVAVCNKDVVEMKISGFGLVRAYTIYFKLSPRRRINKPLTGEELDFRAVYLFHLR